MMDENHFQFLTAAKFLDVAQVNQWQLNKGAIYMNIINPMSSRKLLLPFSLEFRDAFFSIRKIMNAFCRRAGIFTRKSPNYLIQITLTKTLIYVQMNTNLVHKITNMWY